MKKLHLIDCKFGAKGGNFLFENMNYNASISELSIDRNRLRIQGENECGVSTFDTFFAVNNCLKRISFANCDIGDSGAGQIFKGLKRNITLLILKIKKH